jgi:hypothetical protein
VHAKFDINIITDKDLFLDDEICSLPTTIHTKEKKYFDTFPRHIVNKISPMRSMSDEQRNQLVEVWKNPIKMVCFLYRPKFSLYMVI